MTFSFGNSTFHNFLHNRRQPGGSVRGLLDGENTPAGTTSLNRNWPGIAVAAGSLAGHCRLPCRKRHESLLLARLVPSAYSPRARPVRWGTGPPWTTGEARVDLRCGRTPFSITGGTNP